MKKTPPKSKNATKRSKSPSTPRKTQTPTSSDITELPPSSVKKRKTAPSKEKDVPITTLLLEAQKAFDTSQRQPRLTLEQAKEKCRRTIRSAGDSISPKLKPKSKPVSSQNASDSDVKEIKGFLDLTPEEKAAISRMLLESRNQPLEESHAEVLRNKISSVRSLHGATAKEKREMIQMIRAEARLRFDFDF
jgi:hypothetical protein